MKIQIYQIFIFLLLFLSCSKVKKSDFSEYIEQIQHSIEIIDIETERYMIDLEYLQKDISEYHQNYFAGKLQPKEKADTLLQIIDSILNEKGYDQNNPLQSNIEQKGKIEYADILKLKKGFNEIENAFFIAIGDTAGYSNFIEKIKKVVSTSNWSGVRALSGKVISKMELIAVLLKLKLDLKLIKHDVLSFLFSNIAASSFKFSNIEAFVIPNSVILPLGKSYSAEIILASYDTTILLKYVIDGKNFEYPNGKGFYKERVVEKSGEVLKHGEFIVNSPRTGKVLTFPFFIHYRVLKKK
ncbi:MAG: hypothetical protein P1P88_11395 [Bacteroidales bacterium]|nr:hypothetical protein [Bacteroidales bacterium]